MCLFYSVTNNTIFYLFLLLQPQVLKKVAKWPGAGALTRERLLKRVQSHLPAHVLLPPGRLDKLLDQAKMYQIAEIDKLQQNGNKSCGNDTGGRRNSSSNGGFSSLLHQHKIINGTNDYDLNSSFGFSHLLSDISVSSSQNSRKVNNIPSRCVQTLTEHCDEVVHCAFSNSGKHLATCSKDESIKIWKVNLDDMSKNGGMPDNGSGGNILKLERSIQISNAVPAFVKFSPNDRMILV